jgi:hypothetical protein
LRSNVGIFVWSDLALPVNVCAEPDNNLISVQKSHNRDDFQDVPGYVAAMASAFPRDYSAPASSLGSPQVEHEMRARTDVELRTIYVRTADLPASLPSIPTLVYSGDYSKNADWQCHDVVKDLLIAEQNPASSKKATRALQRSSAEQHGLSRHNLSDSVSEGR